MNRDAIRSRIASLTPAERAALSRQARAESARKRRRPLAYAKLWHRPAPRTSQRDTVQAVLGPGVLQAFVLGGNRTGKSHSGAMLYVAWALGRNHPDVQAWARRNGLDISAIQPGPGNVWAVARTDADSRRYVRPKVAQFLPAGSVWRNRDGDGEAEVVLPNGGKITFKSVKQGREGMQGDACHLIGFDEEPKDIGVVNECLMRLADFAGRMLFTMTPLMGWTALLRSYVEKPVADTVVRWLHGEDNPHVPARMLAKLLAKFGTHEQAARRRGEITALEGRVFIDWRRDLHVKAFEPTASWKQFMAIDWGTTVPTSIGLFFYDEGADVVYLRRMVYRTELTVQERAGAILALEAGVYHPDMTRDELMAWARPEEAKPPKVRGPESDVRWADPEDASTRIEIVRNYDIVLVGAKKDIKWGINVVAARLRLDALGRPHFVVHPDCVDFIREIEGYVWAEGKDVPKKENDHAMDMARYGVGGISRAYGLAPPTPTEEPEQAAA